MADIDALYEEPDGAAGACHVLKASELFIPSLGGLRFFGAVARASVEGEMDKRGAAK